MRCDDLRSRLPGYVSGDLPEAEVGPVDAHLDGCPACREDHESLRALVTADHRESRS